MNKGWLLCTDLDRTLIPNGAQTESSNARYYFEQLVNRDDITLAYVTGRDKKLINQAITNYNLPVPDFVVADVGATIYRIIQSEQENIRHNLQWIAWQEWEASFSSNWKGKTNQDINKIFSEISELRKQEVNKQKTYKLSYYVPLYIDHKKLLHTMQTQLNQTGIKAELIWSIDEPNGIGLLDVMPRGATKRHAIEFIMQQNQFNYNNTLFAGDSGNDLDVLMSPIKSILVANAHKDVKNIVEEHLSLPDSDESLYIAKGNFNKMNGNYSAGILEGFIHYVPGSLDWFDFNHPL